MISTYRKYILLEKDKKYTNIKLPQRRIFDIHSLEESYLALWADYGKYYDEKWQIVVYFFINLNIFKNLYIHTS